MHPVGVRTVDVAATSGRTLTVELWYPAEATGPRDRYRVLPGFPLSEQDAVRDLPARAGTYPLVLFSHGFGGHRRQSTFITTHLASHGYLVAAPDHTGTTLVDLLKAGASARSALELRAATAQLEEATRARPADVAAVLGMALGDGRLPVDARRVAVAGHSLGGWTAIAATARDPRIRATLLLAPAGGTTALADDPLRRALDFSWEREVPTLLLAAARDSVLPLAGMHDLYDRVPARTRRLVVFADADHFHFCDRADRLHELMRRMNPRMPPIDTLAPSTCTEPVIRSLALAHFDAYVDGSAAACRWLGGDLAGLLAQHRLRGTVH